MRPVSNLIPPTTQAEQPPTPTSTTFFGAALLGARNMPGAPAAALASSPGDVLAQQIRNGQWNSHLGDVVPLLATRVAGWPRGRGLEILAPAQGLAIRAGTTDPGKTPVRLFLQDQHYQPLVDGVPLHVQSNGHCFFVATMEALGKRHAAVFAPVGKPAWVGFMDAVADYVATHYEDEVKPFLIVDSGQATAPPVSTWGPHEIPTPSLEDFFASWYGASMAPLCQTVFDFYFRGLLAAAAPAPAAPTSTPTPAPRPRPDVVSNPPGPKRRVYSRT